MNITVNESNGKKPWQRIDKKYYYVGAIVTLLVIVGIIGAVFASKMSNNTKKNKDNNGQASDLPTNIGDNPTNTPGNTNTPTQPPVPQFVESPINGKKIDGKRYEEIKSRPPLAVIVQNSTEARPQVGINQADVVYETLAEGGITRWLAIYWSQDAEKIMSVRSLRKYFADITGDYKNVVLMHIGYAEGATNVNAMTSVNVNKIKDLGFRADSFFRDQVCQKTKAQEHCAYTSTSTLWNLAKASNWNADINAMQRWKFKEDNSQVNANGADLAAFTTNFSSLSSGSYSVTWKYDPNEKNYKRYYLNGTAHSDSTGTQIFADVVIYQKINSFPANDEKHHQVQEVIGSGTGHVMQNGKVYDITWKKPDYSTRTKFFDATTGEEFVFNNGRIWNMLVAKGLSYQVAK
jgi:hypothetical protein